MNSPNLSLTRWVGVCYCSLREDGVNVCEPGAQFHLSTFLLSVDVLCIFNGVLKLKSMEINLHFVIFIFCCTFSPRFVKMIQKESTLAFFLQK